MKGGMFCVLRITKVKTRADQGEAITKIREEKVEQSVRVTLYLKDLAHPGKDLFNKVSHWVKIISTFISWP